MEKKQKVTLLEVAKLAGVSRAAAGKVLNGGSDKIGVGAEARKRILEAARQLNYHTNMAASILAGGNSKLIGVFIDSFTSYRTQRLLQEIERITSEQGYRIITSFSHDNIAHMKEDYLMLQRYGVVGFICCAHDYPGFKNEVMELFAGAGNVVFMEKPPVPDMPYVRTSRVEALTRMIADARREGYRKFGILHTDQIYQTERVLRQEFMQAMKNNGMEPDEKLIFEYLGKASPKTRIRQVMEQMILPYRPDFLYIDDAIYTATLRTQLEGTGLKIRLQGGDGDPLFDDINVPTFDPCYEKIAAELLNLLLHPEKLKENPVIEAVYRKDGGCPAGDA